MGQSIPLWPLVGFAEVRLLEVAERSDGAATTTGVLRGPVQGVRVRAADVVPTGWWHLSVGPGTAITLAIQGIDADGEPRGAKRASQPRADGSHQVLFHVPQPVVELTIDYLNPPPSVSLGEIRVRRAGALEVVARVLRARTTGGPAAVLRRIGKGIAALRTGGLELFWAKLFREELSDDYREWVRRYDTVSEDAIKAMRASATEFDVSPVISVILPVYNPEPRLLREAIESVRGQVYPHWELCIADDCSTNGDVGALLDEYEREPALAGRIKIVRRRENGHISRTSNDAVALATGEFVALLDHDDVLAPHALYLVARAINDAFRVGRTLDLLYSDEDKLSEAGERFGVYCKPSINRELLRGQNYICHLSVIRRELVLSVGGFRVGFEGSQDWDLVLRISERIPDDAIERLPYVLYHWRACQGSTARDGDAKPYAVSAGKRAVEEHLARMGVRGEVRFANGLSHLEIEYALPEPSPWVTLIIPTRDRSDLLIRCIESLAQATDYPNFDVVVVNNGTTEPKAVRFLDDLRTRDRYTVIDDPSPFNFSRLNNEAVRRSRDRSLHYISQARCSDRPVIGFLNNDLEVTDRAWLRRLIAHLSQPGVGIVGPKLWYPDGTLQHGGIILGIGGVAGHAHKGAPRGHTGYWNRAVLAHDCSAVTGACLLMYRDLFERVGGFNEEALAVAFNDVDLCLRVREAGCRVRFVPSVELIHHESVSRGQEDTRDKRKRFEREVAYMRERWASVLDSDPYYSPNLTLVTEDLRLSFPPRRGALTP